VSLRDRIGIDVGRKLKLEDAVAWAAANAVRYIDVQLDTGTNALPTLDGSRTAAFRQVCAHAGLRLRRAREPAADRRAHRAAPYGDRVLRGTSPAQLPGSGAHQIRYC
jgi:hypothetical protein